MGSISISPTPSLGPPFITVPDVPNFRCLGPFPIPESPDAPQNEFSNATKIYRSGQLSRINPRGIAKLRTLNVTRIFDLRSGPEIVKYKMPTPYLGPELEIRHVPVFEDKDFSPEMVSRMYRDYGDEVDGGVHGFLRAYQDILESAGPAYGEILRWMVESKEDEAALVHCSGGKDRTGVFCAMVLGLAGVGDEEVANDYQLTEIGLQEWREAAIGKLMEEHREFVGQRKMAERIFGSKAPVMRALIQKVRERWGGWEGWCQEVAGLSREELDIIKKRMVVKADKASL
ncbi:MAG: hypothetical protein M1834_006564 [Cirrosporium novae-zelandiae]|nr:MAG: hypothetical protein M1834_006564 [Cirrosporium novae-zelandiae]